MTTEHQLDADQIATLRMLRDGTLLAGLIRTFRAQTESQLTEIEQALGSTNLGRVAEIAHSLKSSSFTLGATHVGQLSTALESAAMQRDTQQCLMTFYNLKSSYKALLPSLEKEEKC